jgi:hypothetical protein
MGDWLVSIILLVGAALGHVCRAMLGEGDTQIGQVLLAVDGGILGEGLGEVEGALELSVVCVVIFVADGHQIEVAATLV